MSLYAIGDLHLHFGAPLKIGHPQRSDRAWKDHEEKVRKNCSKLLTDADTLVLVGTKGFVFEGPFYLDRRGRVVGWDEKNEEHAKKIVARELERLRVSLEAAKADGYRRFILFLHYPPTSILEDESCFTRIAEEYRAERVIYAHSHGESRFYDSVLGERNGVEYKLVSGDFLKWKPAKIMD